MLSWYEYVREQELHRALWIHLRRSMSPDAQTTAEVQWGHIHDNDDKLSDGRQAEDDGGEKESERSFEATSEPLY